MLEEEFNSGNFNQIDVSTQVQRIISVKDQMDQNNLKKSVEISCHFFSEFINEVEIIIDELTKITHEKISRKMEEKLDKAKISLKKKFGVNHQFYDYSFTPVIQSGGEYDLKPIIESNNNLLKDDIIIMNLGGKYFEMNCLIIRTLLINPTPIDQKNYKALTFLHELTMNNL